MAGPGAILRELHRLRRHARDLQAQLDRGPTQLKNQQARLARQEDALREGQEALRKLKIHIHEKEVSLKAKNQQVDKHRLQLNAASSKKEYDALKVEIAAETEAGRRLEDEILNDLMRVDELAAQLPELEQAAKRAKEELAKFEVEQRTRLGELTAMLAQTQAELQTVETTLPEDIRPAYERLLTARGEDAMSAVANRICSACYTEITAQNHNELLQGLFVLCKSCGRILYLAD